MKAYQGRRVAIIFTCIVYNSFSNTHFKGRALIAGYRWKSQRTHLWREIQGMIPCQSPTERYQTLQILRQWRLQVLLAGAMWLLISLNQTTTKWTHMTGYPDLSDAGGVGVNHAVKFFRAVNV